VRAVSIAGGDFGAANGLSSAGDAELVRSLATMFIDVTDAFGIAMARHLHEQIPDLGGLDDAEAFEATRRNTVGNMREIFSMLRAGLPATAHETPVHALEHARFLRSRGTGYSAMVASYEYGLAMFRAVGGLEIEARVPDAAQRERLALAWDQFVFSFVGQMLERLLHEWDLREGAWHPVAGDAVLANPASAEAARRFRDEQIGRGQWLAASPHESHAQAESKRVLEAFAACIERAANEPVLGRRLALANTTVEVRLADDPDLAVTLLLDRTPPEVVDGGANAQTRLLIASVDLDRLWSKEFQLGMAIVRGRVRYSGQVRKFLRVVPMLRPLAATYRELTTKGRASESPRSASLGDTSGRR